MWFIEERETHHDWRHSRTLNNNSKQQQSIMSPSFSFHHIDPSTQKQPLFSVFEKLKHQLQKWDLKAHLQLLKFRFDEAFQEKDVATFVRHLLRSQEFSGVFQTATRSGSMINFSPPDEKCMPDVEKLPCTVTDMAFFDKLYQHGLVNRETQSLAKCFDQYIHSDGVTLSDRFRVLMGWAMASDDRREDLVECDYDDQAIFNELERREFIFHLMARLAIGGSMSQYEDYFGEYKEATKLLYKDLITVQKNADTGEPEVVSKVYILRDQGRMALFPRDSSFNFMYIVVDPIR